MLEVSLILSCVKKTNMQIPRIGYLLIFGTLLHEGESLSSGLATARRRKEDQIKSGGLKI